MNYDLSIYSPVVEDKTYFQMKIYTDDIAKTSYTAHWKT